MGFQSSIVLGSCAFILGMIFVAQAVSFPLSPCPSEKERRREERRERSNGRAEERMADENIGGCPPSVYGSNGSSY
jgi:hypothetical protein